MASATRKSPDSTTADGVERLGIDAAYLGLIISGAKKRGLDCDRILARVGIDPGLLSKAGGRISQDQFARLISLLTRVTRDEMWLLSGRPIKPGTFKTMCRLLVSCNDLREAIRVGCGFYRLVSDDFAVRLQSNSGEACIWITDAIDDDEQRRTLHGVILFIVYGLVCWLIGRKLPLTTVHHKSANRTINPELPLFYDAPILSNQKRTEIRFDSSFLDCPVIPDEMRLRRFLASVPTVLLVRYRNGANFNERVRGILKRDLTRALSLKDVAERLNVSPATLRRRLQNESNAGFKELRDGVRRDVALHLLLKSRLSLEEIGISVGFSEMSTFYRAFRRWTGQAPGKYRKITAKT